MDAGTVKSTDQILDDAADLFDTGQLRWIQGGESDGVGGACMAHAMCIASGYEYGTANDYLCNTFISFMNARQYAGIHLEELSVARWNDTPGRTIAEVIDKLRDLAKQYREETQRG